MSQPLRTLTVSMKVDAKKYKDGVEQASQVTRRFSVDTNKSLKEVAAEHAHLGKVVSVTEDSSKQLRAEQKRATREVRNQQAAFDKLNDEIARHERMASLGIKSEQDLAAAMRMSNKATDEQIMAYVELDRAARKYRTTSAGMNTDMKAYRGMAQNAGYQIQDFAVQVSAGTSASVALGQQLPQLLSGFGLLGVAAGTVFSVLVPLVGSMVDFGDATDKATEHLGNFNLKMEDLSEKAGASAKKALESAIKVAKAQLTAQEKTLQKRQETLKSLEAEQKAIGDTGNAYGNYGNKQIMAMQKTEAARSEVSKAEADLIKYEGAVIEAQEALDEFTGAADRATEAEKKAAAAKKKKQKAIERVITQLREENAELTYGEDKAEEYMLISNGITDAKLAEYHALKKVNKELQKEADFNDMIAGYLEPTQLEQDIELTKKALADLNAWEYGERAKLLTALDAMEDEKMQKDAKRSKSTETMMLTTMNTQLAMMSTMTEEGSAAANAVFLMQQSLAAAQVVMNTQAAKAKVVADMGAAGAAWHPFLDAQMGVSLGLIAGQTIANFAQGGRIGAGQWGIVDEYGKEKMTARGGAQGSIVYNGTNESMGVDPRGGQQPVVNHYSITFPISTPDAAGVKKWLMENRKTIYQAVNAESRNLGKPM